MGALGSAMGQAFGITAVTVFLFLVFTLFWVRRTVKGQAYCIFIEPNNQIGGQLAKVDEGGGIIIGKGEDAQTYKTMPRKQLWSMWPPGFPKFVQEPVPTYIYVRNHYEPVDPRQKEGIITARQLRIISDEAMLKTTWKDVRETTGAPTGKTNWKIIFLVIGIILVIVILYMLYQNNVQLGELQKIFGPSTPTTPAPGGP